MFESVEFFDLALFAHADLFQKGVPVWEALKRIEEYVMALPLGKIEGVVEKGVFFDKPELISIGPGTKIESGAYIRGPCVIGADCEVRHGAYIRGNVMVGDRCVIGHATEVKNTIFLNQAQAGHFAYVGDSILGNDTNLGAGTKCANLRLDRASIVVDHEGKKIDSGLRKFGAIVGDGTQIGCNAVLNPGSILEKESLIYPGSVIRGTNAFKGVTSSGM